MMRKFRKGADVVAAVQITNATFDADHPNPEHITGILYDAIERCAFIERPNGRTRANLGDWIVREADGGLYVCNGSTFAATYEPV
jgi:hypothetical protein